MLRNRPLNRNFQTIPRRFNGLCLNEIGYLPRKTERIRHRFSTFNYSIILSGEGSYLRDGREIEISTPCVLTQTPGELAVYGPPANASWEELYLILSAEKQDYLKQAKLIGDDPNYWTIRNHSSVLSAVRALLAQLESSARRAGLADLVDHLAERVVMETLLPGETASDPSSRAVANLAQAMAAAPDKTYDYQEFANDFGISYSTFQRKWREIHEAPPGQYLLSLRISECCRLLVETNAKTTDIARQLGFLDPAYYSRLFKQRIGMTPTQYRTLHSHSN